ncbi:transcriptional regulator [Pseudomonas gessardii]|uniref:Transcriptional regulator n=1 Tax=Pseudomonas gessardii TaxID=78544 RepID=A0A7Y1QPL7_9PSED|nr:transcriptional regulator [Pseudomonas gessardii]NNA98762.1 transcriptional regulator [Pseudomonas gessardii]
MGLHSAGSRGQGFLEDLVSGRAAYHSLHPGIGLYRLNAGPQPGLALQIAPEALQAGQLERVLERRFEHATVFDGCFVFLDANGSLVIWHALAPNGRSPDDILSRLLSLARLETLDVHRAP